MHFNSRFQPLYGYADADEDMEHLSEQADRSLLSINGHKGNTDSIVGRRRNIRFCFLGIPKGSIVSVSTIGVKQNSEALHVWEAGMREMIKQIEPSVILVYGGELDFDYGDIEVIYFDNKVTKNWRDKK